MVRIYDITLTNKDNDFVVGGIYLEDSEGDWNHATTLAIDAMRNTGMEGAICYKSHEVTDR